MPKIVENIKDHSIIVSPAKGGTVELVAKAYKQAGGEKVIGMDFPDDTDGGYPGLARELYDESVPVNSWRDQPQALIQKADAVLVFGYSAGVTGELCLTKYFWPKEKKIYIIKELCDPLPKFLEEELHIEYLSWKDSTYFSKLDFQIPSQR